MAILRSPNSLSALLTDHPFRTFLASRGLIAPKVGALERRPAIALALWQLGLGWQRALGRERPLCFGLPRVGDSDENWALVSGAERYRGSGSALPDPALATILHVVAQ